MLRCQPNVGSLEVDCQTRPQLVRFFVAEYFGRVSGLPDGFFSNQKYQFG
jgi:hypothetical protein